MPVTPAKSRNTQVTLLGATGGGGSWDISAFASERGGGWFESGRAAGRALRILREKDLTTLPTGPVEHGEPRSLEWLGASIP
jgi:hypothetical protein